ncbi:MAG TPA: glycoside hydrolase family 20 zincin-like fold domain-containing protein [Candidatus Hydrogenedentes bacterium]|nr:glycoside hydrolase family 20 zincin-like fold domain-containing protein [Candidatus Hydrogenedentota bacterium]
MAACVLLLSLPVGAEQDAQTVATALSGMDAWILAPPKSVEPLPGVSFDLADCKGIVCVGEGARELRPWAAARLAAMSGVTRSLLESADGPAVALVLVDEPTASPPVAGIDDATLAQLGDQGYVLIIDANGVMLAARGIAGLRYAVTTLAQIAADRTVLPGMIVRDWPALKYRGVQQDVSRGQVPTPDTMKRLADVLAEGKMNELEFYLEHVYKYKAFPDISPPEGYTPEEARDFAAHAARAGVEVHPLLQGLGHAYHILSKPQYEHLRIGPCEKMPWIMTFDIRKPEAVQMVTTMIDELCETFPGELFNIDITEIDIDGLQADGTPLDQVTDLVFGYVLKLNEAVSRHGRRLMITQGPLDSQGHLAGMGPKLDALPKDIIIGSYYCAGGPYQPAWEKDFPRLREKGFDFFAQAWIYSHLWLTPWVNRAAEFSDLEVARGLQHGAIGSITCDWGDAGHFHFVGEEWLSYLYHGACAWSGAQMDRDYFRKACARVLYGLDTDAAIRAIEAASDVNAKTVRVRDKDGNETDASTNYIWEFVHDPFTHADITRIADPVGAGQAILEVATPALATLSEEWPKAKRNRDNLEQWLFGVRCYAALGHKLVALGHYNDVAVPRKQVADELEAVAKEFETLQTGFQRLWLAEDRNNDGFQELVRRFTYTIVPCREKAAALRAP